MLQALRLSTEKNTSGNIRGPLCLKFRDHIGLLDAKNFNLTAANDDLKSNISANSAS